MNDDAYAELGLAAGASETEVKAAWRRLASQWHPDRNPSASASNRMQRINEALERIRRAGFAAAPKTAAPAAPAAPAAAPQPSPTGAPAGKSPGSHHADDNKRGGFDDPADDSDQSDGGVHGRHGGFAGKQSNQSNRSGKRDRSDDGVRSDKGDQSDPNDRHDDRHDDRDDLDDSDDNEAADEAAAPSDTDADAKAPRRIRRKLKLTLEEAAAGCVKSIRGKLVDRCLACAGVGHRMLAGACSGCGGTGQTRRRAWFGWVGDPVQCAACEGDGVGKVDCDPCAGIGRLPPHDWRISVRIPHGARDGDLLQVSGKPPAGTDRPLQLELRVEVMPHPLFELADDGTLHCTVPVDGFVWLAERSIDVPTLDGQQRLPLRRQQVDYRLTGAGFPAQRRGPRADQLVRLKPLFADRLGTDQQILLDQLAATALASGATPATPELAEWQRLLRQREGPRGKRAG